MHPVEAAARLDAVLDWFGSRTGTSAMHYSTAADTVGWVVELPGVVFSAEVPPIDTPVQRAFVPAGAAHDVVLACLEALGPTYDAETRKRGLTFAIEVERALRSQ